MQSKIKLIESQEFNTHLVLNYLYRWKHQQTLVIKLLNKLYLYLKQGDAYLLSLAIFIIGRQNNSLIGPFCQKIAKQSLCWYLNVRWAYTSYIIQNQSLKNKLDNCMVSKNIQQNQQNLQKLMAIMQQNCQKVQYMIRLNDFYQRLYRTPSKLQHIEENQRKKYLKQRIVQLMSKFKGKEYLPGIALPLFDKPQYAVDVALNQCYSLSTKQRIPFKLVFLTLNYQDINHYKRLITLQIPKQLIKQQIKQQIQPKSKRLIKNLTFPQSYFGQPWTQISQKIKKQSIFKKYQSLQVYSLMVKAGDDLRQEQVAMQLIRLVEWICKKQGVKLWLRPYGVAAFDQSSGVIQWVQDTRTVSYLKSKSSGSSLLQIYRQLFTQRLDQAIGNFVQSLAGYSLIQYLFQVRDRHNNNILIDRAGHILHIDFAFFMGNSPGNVGFQKAPFKLTAQYLELLGGPQSDFFRHFKHLLFFGLKYIAKYKGQILQRIDSMSSGGLLKGLSRYDRNSFEKRFLCGLTEKQLLQAVEYIVESAIGSYTTSHYDKYQWLTNTIHH